MALDTKQLIEQTIEDTYTAGDMSDKEYHEAVAVANDPKAVAQVDSFISKDQRERWTKAIADYRNKTITTKEYVETVEGICDEVDEARASGVNYDYDRAMKGIH